MTRRNWSHLIVPERVDELVDLTPGDLRQAPRLVGVQPYLGADGHWLSEESIPQHGVNVQPRQRALDLG
jgi:hypothetical protein